MDKMNEQRNLILAVVLSVVILLGFQWLFPSSKTVEQRTGAPTETAATPAVPGAPVAPAIPAAPPSRDEVLAKDTRLKIKTANLHGSISLTGGRVDDLTLVRYHEHPDPSSPEIVLLSPPAATSGYYAEFGWVPADQKIAVPGPDAKWTASGDTLTPQTPVTLTWDNGQGLRFTRVVSIDDHYMFTVKQTVENKGTAPVTLFPYALISRTGKPHTQDYYILHEGPLGVLDGTLKEFKYKDLDEKGSAKLDSTGGWLGITDKYWLTALVPDQKAELSGSFHHLRTATADKYQVDYLRRPVEVAPGASAEVTNRLFAGAKQVELLDKYEQELGIVNFDLAVDFGWFYFLTKPFFHLLQFIHGMVGNFGIAILIMTVIIKALFFPLANKSYKSMSAMKKLQPQVKALQEKFADDRQRMNTEMMALYKREKVNPVSGCLPILVQIPVFFALYKVLFVAIEMRHAPFYGWIKDLSAPDPTTIFNLFGLIPWTPPMFLMIGIWPLIMGVTMWLQQKLNPQPADPVQAKMFMFLPIVFTFLLASFPAGLVIYWAWSNLLSILQQWVIMKKMGVSA